MFHLVGASETSRMNVEAPGHVFRSKEENILLCSLYF